MNSNYLDNLSHRGAVTYLATRECLDLISGMESDMMRYSVSVTRGMTTL